MPDDPRVQELLDRLSDSDATPEAVCESCTELLPVVRARWRQMCQAREDLDALFPAEDGSGSEEQAGESLPVIPGYEVEAELGRGGMGIVYRARHVRLNRVVALKMVLAGGPRERERFRREAEAAAALRHPNVVQVHDVGDAAGRSYFTMEYVEGGSLAQKLDGKPLPIREAAGLLLTLAGAVEAAHAAGIVHRDLKPGNVLLTADGTPKVGDFGLARRLGDEDGLTRTGTAVGTPSYMAPEQAGESKAVPGPPADIYSLGALLYELLTGRPPFQAGNAVVTMYRTITQDPVPPSRLNGKVPQDLETICLTCLRKEPRLRYPTAAALGADLRRFLDGEAIAARPEGRLARLARRIRRRPFLSAAVLVAILSMAALVCGGVWAASEREEARQTAALKQAAADAEAKAIEAAADADLNEMEEAIGQCSWPRAAAACDRATIRLRGRGSDQLRQRIEQGTRDLELVTRWEAIRLNSFVREDETDGLMQSVSIVQADGEFEAAFRAAGFGRVGDDDEVVARRVRASHLRTFLAAELESWALLHTEDHARKKWLVGVARQTDANLTGWQARAAQPRSWRDDQSTAELLATAPPGCPPLLLLTKAELALATLGKDPIPTMRKCQQSHASNFWVNLRLADVLLMRDKPGEAIGYYHAALAARPRTAVVCNNMAVALKRTGRDEEAVEQYRRAVEYDPAGRLARFNLVVQLERMRRHAEVIVDARAALQADSRHDPVSIAIRTLLGRSLAATGRDDEAADVLRRVADAEPKNLLARRELRDILMRRGKLADAKAVWGEALQTDPPLHIAWYGYAEFCLFLGDEAEYHRARTALLAKFGRTTDPAIAERVARAALLAPASGTDLERAVALAVRAAAVDRQKVSWEYPYYQFVRGLSEYRQGQFGQAITTLRGDAGRRPGPTPQLVLAMALQRDGREAEARNTLAAAVVRHDWRASQVKDQDGWIEHALRREAEGLILPGLRGFVDKHMLPQDGDERLILLGDCQFTNRNLTVARLFTAAFADAPALAADFKAGHRSSAARYAALAGCGRGADVAGLSDSERARWRAQAREWLRADLAAWGKALDANPAAARDDAKKRLEQWRTDPDLASLRESTELDTLPADERKDCIALWAEVNAVLARCKR